MSKNKSSDAKPKSGSTLASHAAAISRLTTEKRARCFSLEDWTSVHLDIIARDRGMKSLGSRPKVQREMAPIPMQSTGWQAKGNTLVKFPWFPNTDRKCLQTLESHLFAISLPELQRRIGVEGAPATHCFSVYRLVGTCSGTKTGEK